MFNYFANPRRFMKLATGLSPWLAGATAGTGSMQKT